MESAHEILVRCDHCGAHQPKQIVDTINVSLEPELKERLFNGEFAQYECMLCQKSIPLSYTLIYEDPMRHLIIALEPERATTDTDTQSGYASRVVHSFHELVEKIRVFDDELDDRIIELTKLRLWNELSASHAIDSGIISYLFMTRANNDETLERGVFALVLEGSVLPFDVPWKDTYGFIQNRVRSLLTPLYPRTAGWQTVDRRFALEILDVLRSLS